MNPAELTPLTARRGAPLQGRVRVPGDKSISHRALILGALTVGERTVSDLLEGEDVLHTAAAMRALGARLERTPEGIWRIQGVGVGGFAQPARPLDFGNSGTGCRLAIGAVAGAWSFRRSSGKSRPGPRWSGWPWRSCWGAEGGVVGADKACPLL